MDEEFVVVPKSVSIIFEKNHFRDYTNELLDVAEFCSKQKIPCHFVVDGRDLLYRQTFVQAVKYASQVGEIVVDPGVLRAGATSRQLLHATEHSAELIKRYLGFKPALVYHDILETSSSHGIILQSSGYTPVCSVCEESSKIVKITLSRDAVLVLRRTLADLKDSDFSPEKIETQSSQNFI